MPTAIEERTEVKRRDCLDMAIDQLAWMQGRLKEKDAQLHRSRCWNCWLAGLLVVIVIGAAQIIWFK